MKFSEGFTRFAKRTARAAGQPTTFVIAVAITLIWAVTGPIFNYSDSWQLVINTGTTIITFLMVFVIQNTQNRDAVAMHIKLDELIHAMKGARDQLIDIEDLTEEELERLQTRFAAMAHRSKAGRGRGAAEQPEEPQPSLSSGEAPPKPERR
jgi:low affinity Fe/Cu permease